MFYVQLRLWVTYLLKTLKYLEIIRWEMQNLFWFMQASFHELSSRISWPGELNEANVSPVFKSFYRSTDISFPDVFGKKVLKNFLKFAGKHLCGSLLLKIRLLHECFTVNFAKFLRTALLDHSESGSLEITEVVVTVTSFICRRH